MRKSLCASVLVLALCGSAFAGDITNPPAPGAITNPPNTAQAPGDETGDGQPDAEVTPTTDGVIQANDVDGLTAAALSVLNSVLALF